MDIDQYNSSATIGLKKATASQQLANDKAEKKRQQTIYRVAQKSNQY